jgi:hypothetical protein
MKHPPKGARAETKDLNRTQRKELQKELRALAAVPLHTTHPLLTRLSQVAIFLLGFVGGATVLQVHNSYPNVTSTAVDTKNAFLFPFVVSNDQNLVTFYGMQVWYRWTVDDPGDAKAQKQYVNTTSQSVSGVLGPPVDLHPYDKFPFTVGGGGRLPVHLPPHATVEIVVRYSIHLFFVPWWRERQFGFLMQKGSDETAIWVPLYAPQP